MNFVAIGVKQRTDGQIFRIGAEVMRELVTVAVNGLMKIAVTIKQADSDKRNAEVTGGLAMIAGENTESAGINRKAFMETKLGAEIGDQICVRIQQ